MYSYMYPPTARVEIKLKAPLKGLDPHFRSIWS